MVLFLCGSPHNNVTDGVQTVLIIGRATYSRPSDARWGLKVDRRSESEILLEALEALGDEDLYKPYASFVPGGGDHRLDPVIKWIVGNTYEHFDEHHGYIRALLQGIPTSKQ